MKANRSLSQKTSPLLAAAAGVAICLSGDGAHAVSGNITASNAGNTSFDNGDFVKVFNSKATFRIQAYTNYGYVNASLGTGDLPNMSFVRYTVASLNSKLFHGGTGVTFDAADAFATRLYNGGGAYTDAYIGARFDDGGTRYGWIHVVASITNGTSIQVDAWAYDPTGGGIKTLDESITPKAMPLSDGSVKLHWANADESGVARYEVQAQGADGVWAAINSDTPGAGTYAATVKAGTTCRLLVESVDGTSRTLDF